MPVTYGTYQKQIKLLPLVLLEDGRATVTIRSGFIDQDKFISISENTHYFEPDVVSSILDVPASSLNISRRDDLSLAIYNYLIEAGVIEPGTIS